MQNKFLRGFFMAIMTMGLLLTPACDLDDESDDDDYVIIEGSWTISGLGDCVIVQNGNSVTIHTSFETYTGSLDGNSISFSAKVEDWLHVYDGSVNGDSMSGAVDYDSTHIDASNNVGTWSAVKQ